LPKAQTSHVFGSAINPAVVNDRLHQIEIKHDLLRFKIDGWCVWPLFRFDVAIALQNLSFCSSHGAPLKGRYFLAAKDLFRLARLTRARFVAKTYSSARAEKQNGLYKDIYFDDLLSEMGHYFKIESINNQDFLSQNRMALLKTDMTTLALEMFLRRLGRMSRPGSILKISEELSSCLRQESRLEDFSSEKIASCLANFYWAKKFYRWLLGKINPQYLFTADFGETGIVAAAKELGIKVIEFQHGITDRNTYGYSWSSYALPYKKAMPVADQLFLYGNYWADELRASGFWDEELRSVGSLRLDAYRNLGRENRNREDAHNLLLTMQGSNIEKVLTFISEFTALAKGKIDFRLFIKLHPLYEKNKKTYLEVFQNDPNVQVLLGNENPSTFELLSRANLHVSVYSACHYEALALGVPTVILPFAGSEHVLHLHETGQAFLAKTPQELLEIVLKAKDQRAPEEVGEYYFKLGALENMKAELNLNGKSKRGYQQCSRCALDISANDIRFDSKGVCNYCRNYDEETYRRSLTDEKEKREKLDKIVSEIKSSGANKKYDCIVGLSGGTDSTYLVHLAKKLGLRPLAVHFDNGWDSELAVRNIAHVTRKLNVDLYSYVIDWEEFKDLQLAYLKASVVDIEVPTDQLIFASLYRVAHQKGIKSILCGNNHVTEFTMPTGWNYPAKFDSVNLGNIHRKYGKVKLRDFPRLGYFERYFYDKVARIRSVNLLDFVPYDKKEAKHILTEELGWRDYGYKHYESIFTRFYQGYILPRKFHIDKRKAHLSNLICSGQMTREEALAELKKDPYPLGEQKADKEYVIKKLGLTEGEFEDLMNLPARSHNDFGRERDYFKYPRILFQSARASFKKVRN